MLLRYWQRSHAEKRWLRSMTDAIMRLFTSRICIAVTALAIMVMLAVLLIVSAANAEEVQAPTGMVVFVAEGSWLNIRERPSGDAPVTIRMELGDALDVYAVDANGWAEIGRAGDSGYCRVEYLLDSLPSEPIDYVATVNHLRVRKLPCDQSIAVRKLHKGATVSVLGFVTIDGERWARVVDGFIMAGYLSAED